MSAAAPPIDHDRLRTLWDVLAWHAQATPDAVALDFEGRQTGYAALRNASSGLAGALAREGVRRGERVAYLGKNSDVYFVLLYALARLGAVLVPLNWRLAKEEWEFILADSGAVALFSDESFADAARALRADARLLGWARHDPALADAPLPDADDIVFQVYTSGTTGRPKGAMLSHRNMLALRAPGYRAGLPWFPGRTDTTLAILPVAHIAGTAYALFGLYGGGRIVIGREFSPALTLELIARQHVSHMLLAPAAMRQILDHPAAGATDLSSLRVITYGASPIPEELLRRALATFGCGFVQMYGMSEAAGGVVALSPEDHLSGIADRLRSAGRAMPGVEVAILDEAGRIAPTGGPGEILIRSAAVMPGYWRLPEATAAAITPEGWLRTGDVGRIDAEGYVYVLDRTKDMIVSGGENIYPAEVENAIFGHPDVADVAVIGVPSQCWGEEVMAIVVPREGSAPTLETIAAWARQRIAGFKVPRQLALVAELPRNAGQKVLRRELREPYWRGVDRRVN
ncbi:AMP-binding protein [Flavisphingomonas formosensis]|uniref:AMP-binding protein n=1 Tax=Flavisphingomonas formosensis TaxID=861534 RepID=UPI0012FC7E50|nr:AMP-binding protein [Sphingomonas formosensis]